MNNENSTSVLLCTNKVKYTDKNETLHSNIRLVTCNDYSTDTLGVMCVHNMTM